MLLRGGGGYPYNHILHNSKCCNQPIKSDKKQNTLSLTVNLQNIMKIFACAEQNSMLIEHTAGSLSKVLIFYILQNLNIKIEIQKTSFYRFYFFLRFYDYNKHMFGQI